MRDLNITIKVMFKSRMSHLAPMKRQVILCGVHHLLIWSILFSSCTLFSSFTWLTAPPWSVGWKGIQNISKHLLETKFIEFWRWLMLSLFDYSPINPNFTWTNRRLYSALWTPVIWVCGWCMHARRPLLVTMINRQICQDFKIEPPKVKLACHVHLS